MSDLKDLKDLKDLAWTVQSTATAPDFDTIVRRAHRRRTRRQAVTAAATATAVVAVAAVTATSPLRDRSGDPATTVPPPTQTSILPPLRAGRDIVTAPGAQLQGVSVLAKDRWLAVWELCNADESDCQQTFVARDGNRSAVSAAHRDPIWGQRDLGRLTGFIPPPEGNNGPQGPTVEVFTGPGLLLTQDGSKIRETKLTPGPPVTRFDDDDILFADEPGPWVIDRSERTVHMLTLPSEFTGDTRFGGLSRDLTGRVWLTAGSPTGYLLWSEDGRHWEKVALGTDAWSAWFEVSPDGRTVVLATFQDNKPHGPLRISHDGGHTWQNLATIVNLDGLAAFDDGSILVSTSKLPGRPAQLSRINRDLTNSVVPGSPQIAGGLGSSGDTVYGRVGAFQHRGGVDRSRGDVADVRATLSRWARHLPGR